MFRLKRKHAGVCAIQLHHFVWNRIFIVKLSVPQPHITDSCPSPNNVPQNDMRNYLLYRRLKRFSGKRTCAWARFTLKHAWFLAVFLCCYGPCNGIARHGAIQPWARITDCTITGGLGTDGGKNKAARRIDWTPSRSWLRVTRHDADKFGAARDLSYSWCSLANAHITPLRWCSPQEPNLPLWKSGVQHQRRGIRVLSGTWCEYVRPSHSCCCPLSDLRRVVSTSSNLSLCIIGHPLITAR